jgi:hypothetical protein
MNKTTWGKYKIAVSFFIALAVLSLLVTWGSSVFPTKAEILMARSSLALMTGRLDLDEDSFFIRMSVEEAIKILNTKEDGPEIIRVLRAPLSFEEFRFIILVVCGVIALLFLIRWLASRPPTAAVKEVDKKE